MMKNKQIIFCIECTEGKKEIDKKSDQVYIKKLLNNFYEDIKKSFQVEYLHMGGKHKYKNEKFKKLIKEKINLFKFDDKNKETDVVYVIDKDKFDSDPQDEKFISDIDKYCKKEKYQLIFFTRDIEDVLLGKKITKDKSKEAQRLKYLKMMMMN